MLPNLIYGTFCLSLMTGTVLSTSQNSINLHINEDAVDVGNWTVGDCILAKFAMDFTIYTKNGYSSKIRLPSSAIAARDKNGTLCSKDVQKKQTLILSWNEAQKKQH